MCGFTPQTISSASNLRDAESTERRGSHSEGDRGLLLRGGHRFPPGHRDMDPERRKQSISEKEMEAGGQSGGQSAGPGRRAEGYRRQVRLGTESPAAGGAEEAPSGGWTGGVGGSPGVCPSIPRRRAGRLGAAAPGRRPGPPGSAAGGPSRGQCILRPAACPWNTHCHHCPLHPGASGGPGEEHHHPWPWALPFLLAQARPEPGGLPVGLRRGGAAEPAAGKGGPCWSQGSTAPDGGQAGRAGGTLTPCRDPNPGLCLTQSTVCPGFPSRCTQGQRRRLAEQGDPWKVPRSRGHHARGARGRASPAAGRKVPRGLRARGRALAGPRCSRPAEAPLLTGAEAAGRDPRPRGQQ